MRDEDQCEKGEEQTQASTMGLKSDIGAARQSLREQIESRFYHSQEEASQARRLGTLRRMIDKYPEVFEMISLMRDLNIL